MSAHSNNIYPLILSILTSGLLSSLYVMDAYVLLFYFMLSYLEARDPERILPYVDRGTFVFWLVRRP